ncbi:MAG: phosphomannomutase/phosphoglucomutase [Oscillospiraceae bacterium]|nr:phosphomannomutase/phosphoglucomutase [Oscillospiraceae bacterium]
MTTNWQAFKSGSDIRGLGLTEESNPLYLSDFAVGRMAAGFAAWLAEKLQADVTELTVAVGHDCRVSSERIKNAVIAELTRAGVNVKDCGLSSTPAMFLTTLELNCGGAIQITASHHPMDKNGLKFFTRFGGLDGADIEKILRNAEQSALPTADVPGTSEAVSFMEDYAAMLRDMICREVNAADYSRPLRGYKIAVDAGNGVGGFYASEVLEPLGADVSGSIFLEPDGTFPNHAPNPEDKAAMRFAAAATIESGSDLGVIFDTDVDRAGCVGRDGAEINRNALVALASYIALERHDGGTVVTDSVTSDGLTRFIESLGGRHLRYKRGYRNVINKQIELIESGVDCPLAIETSGHAAFRDNYFLDDGAYLVTKIIIKMAELGKHGKSLESILEGLEHPAEERESRIKILTQNFAEVGGRFIDAWRSFAAAQPGWTAAEKDYEGVRFSTDKNAGDGWILARLSVHDPVIVINAESNMTGGTEVMLRKFREFAGTFSAADKLDLSGL